VTEPDRACTIQVSSNPIHIMRSSGTQLSCGTKSQPWILEAPVGLQISINLLQAGVGSSDPLPSPRSEDSCQPYGYLIDKRANNKNVSLCRHSLDRNKFVYKSSSNYLEVVLSNQSDSDTQAMFLVGVRGAYRSWSPIFFIINILFRMNTFVNISNYFCL